MIKRLMIDLYDDGETEYLFSGDKFYSYDEHHYLLINSIEGINGAETELNVTFANARMTVTRKMSPKEFVNELRRSERKFGSFSGK